MNSSEYLEIKSLLLEQKAMLQMLIPNKATVSYISMATGRSRQTITSYLKNNFEPEVDYWVENGKICLSKTTTIALLRRYNER